MSTVLQATSAGSTCLTPTSVGSTCLQETSAASTCLEALEPELGFFRQDDPLVQITTLDFGIVVVGSFLDLVVIARNIGTLTLNLCDFLIEGLYFSYVSLPGDTELEAGEEALITIRYAPLA